MKKPVAIVYGSDDRPPLAVTVLTGVQHAGVNAIFLMFPLLVSREAGLSTLQIGDVLSLAMLVMAAATVIQAYPPRSSSSTASRSSRLACWMPVAPWSSA